MQMDSRALASDGRRLTYRNRDEMVAISQVIFWSAFVMKKYEFCFNVTAVIWDIDGKVHRRSYALLSIDKLNDTRRNTSMSVDKILHNVLGKLVLDKCMLSIFHSGDQSFTNQYHATVEAAV